MGQGAPAAGTSDTALSGCCPVEVWMRRRFAVGAPAPPAPPCLCCPASWCSEAVMPATIWGFCSSDAVIIWSNARVGCVTPLVEEDVVPPSLPTMLGHRPHDVNLTARGGHVISVSEKSVRAR